MRRVPGRATVLCMMMVASSGLLLAGGIVSAASSPPAPAAVAPSGAPERSLPDASKGVGEATKGTTYAAGGTSESSKGASSKAVAGKGDVGKADAAKTGSAAKAGGAGKADADPRSTQELAVLYQRLSEQAEKATLCVFDPKCVSSDRKVLDLFVQRREILDKIAARAERGDLEAGYWRGTMAMEQGKRQMHRGELQSDDLGSRKEAMYIAAVGAEEFRIAARFLKLPADKGLPEACDRLAEILAQGMGVAPDTRRAAEYYRCAGLGYLKEGRKDEAAQVVGKMRGFLPGNHMYVVELYAKLITREPNAPWRVPAQLAAELSQMK